jgi:arylformamidase
MEPSMSLSDREREYSPSSCTDGRYEQFLDEYLAASEAALKQHVVQRNLSYGDKASNRLDFFPAGITTELPPLLVFIHGGYWQELTKDSSLFPANGCVPNGIAFAAIDYTLAPEATLLEIVLECRDALRWLHAHASELGFDREHIVLAGSSAGAHLAAMCCLRGWEGDIDLPAGLPETAVLVSGIYVLSPLIGTSIDKVLSLTPPSAALVSPGLLSLEGFPPAVVCWGEFETAEFKRQSADFASRIHKSRSGSRPGISAFEVPSRNHFNVILELAQRHSSLGDAVFARLVHR